MNKKVVPLVLFLWTFSVGVSLFVVGLLELEIAYASPYTNVDVYTAYSMITNGSYPDLVVLDVRTQSEYDSGHVYGAVWIPVSELDSRINELAGHENHEIIVYCLSGGRSATASEILDSSNFTKVYNMLGGITAWQSADYPIWIATVQNLDTTFGYDTIQAAIDAPQTLDGHTILVEAGTYYENVAINKSISLVGENGTHPVIDGKGTGNLINITAHHVNVTGFIIQNGTNGIFIKDSSFNFITGNIVTDNKRGISFTTCPMCPDPGRENSVINNTIKNNEFGINLDSYAGNIIHHNNFIGNTMLQIEFPGVDTVWDNGYPSGGNYWSNHNVEDLHSGPYQNETGRDEIGDIPYAVDEQNKDRFPLIYPSDFVPSPNVNNDGIVNILDILATAVAFGSQPGDPSWNPRVDLDRNGIINILDILVIAVHFGEIV